MHSTSKRIVGVDLARALAIIGMIIVNFKSVFGEEGSDLLKSIAGIFDGKAAATFVVLAGVGLAFMSNRAVRENNLGKLRTARHRILKRAVFLFVIGLSYLVLWPADILHFYGIYMLLALPFIGRTDKSMLLAAAGLIFSYPLLLLAFDYDAGWDFTTLEYLDFWTLSGFFRNLLYNGFHPVLPWAAFLLFGLWFGRQDLQHTAFLKKAFWTGGGVFLTMQLLSFGALALFSEGDPAIWEELALLFGTSPMPPLPIYMINGIAAAVTIICACILLTRRYPTSRLLDALVKTGQLALTFYVAHVVVGIGIVEVFLAKPLGSYSIAFSLGYAFLFSLGCVLFAASWRKHRKAGPLEWVMRKITG